MIAADLLFSEERELTYIPSILEQIPLPLEPRANKVIGCSYTISMVVLGLGPFKRTIRRRGCMSHRGCVIGPEAVMVFARESVRYYGSTRLSKMGEHTPTPFCTCRSAPQFQGKQRCGKTALQPYRKSLKPEKLPILQTGLGGVLRRV